MNRRVTFNIALRCARKLFSRKKNYDTNWFQMIRKQELRLAELLNSPINVLVKMKKIAKNAKKEGLRVYLKLKVEPNYLFIQPSPH